MILYHPYAESLIDHPRLADTWTALAAWRGPLRHQPCGADTRYEEGIKALWRTGCPFLVCEQDIVPTVPMITALATCPKPFCAQAYLLHHDLIQYAAIRDWFAVLEQQPSTRKRLRQWAPYPDTQTVLATDTPYTLAHRVLTGNGWRWGQPEDSYADYAGLGLTKLSPRGLPPDWAPGIWSNLDGRISEYLHDKGCRFHVHWPIVPHHHGCACHPDPE